MSDAAEALSTLLVYVQAEGRVCPQPKHWSALYDLLPDKQLGSNAREPALPLILAAWWHTTHLEKMLRLREHIEYAAAHSALETIDVFLRNLPPDGWLYISEK